MREHLGRMPHTFVARPAVHREEYPWDSRLSTRRQ